MSPSRPFLLALIALFAHLGIAADARAGTYDVLACDAGSEAVNRSWSYETSHPSEFEGATICPSSPSVSGIWGMPASGAFTGSYARTIIPGGGTAPPRDAYARWTLQAPSGTTIRRLRIKRWLGLEAGSGWYLYGRMASGALLAGESCTVISGADECNVGGPTSGVADFSSLLTSSLSYGFTCLGAGSCAGGFTIHAARAAIYSARVTIDDPAGPSTGTIAGPLLAGGLRSGTQSVSLTASDAQSGISALRAYVDNTLVATTTRACDFTEVRPCTNATAEAIVVDTAQLPDGTHTLELAAVDAGGNETRATSSAFVSDNHAPDAPQSLIATGSGPGFALAWTAAPEAGAPVTAVRYRLCPTDGAPCQAEQRVAAGAQDDIAVTVAARGQWTAEVWLEDSLGHESVANAATAVLDYPAATPPPAVRPTIAPPAPPSEPATPTAAPALDGAVDSVTEDVPAVVPSTQPAPFAPSTPTLARAGLPVPKNVRLTISAVRRERRAISLRGSASTASGTSLTVSFTVRLGARQQRATARASVRNGAWKATLRLPTALGRAPGSLEVRFSGDEHHLAARIRRAVPAR